VVSSVGRNLPRFLLTTRQGDKVVMKIVYFANTKNKKYQFVKDIQKGLSQLNYQVVLLPEDTPLEKIKKECENADLFLFHEGGVKTETEFDFQLTCARLQNILDNIKCKKVFWFPHLVIGLGNSWMEQIIPFVDYGFLTDGHFVRRHKYDNLFHLPISCLEGKKGKERQEFKTDIAFVGSLFPERELFVNLLKKRYGHKVKVFQDLYGQDFYDLCQSAKIVVYSPFPYKDYYWTDALYRGLAGEAFIVFPKLEGLKEEGFVNGFHYITYSDKEELFLAVDYYLEKPKERKIIASQGKEFVLENYEIKQQLKKITEKLWT